MNETIIRIGRKARHLLQTFAEPTDWAARMLNNKHGYPPLRLRQQVGDMADFEGSGGEYLAYLKLLCDLRKGSRVLDIGCGCGLLTLNVTGSGGLMEQVGDHGFYLGCDTNKDLVNWCNKHLSDIRCRFATDVKEYDHYLSFDVVVCKSLFTHLLLLETCKYLRLIHRALTSKGKALTTWFLIHERRTERGKYRFPHRRDGDILAFERDTKPDLAVAYRYDRLAPMLSDLGFRFTVHWGTWRKDSWPGLSFQDIIILERKV